MANEKRLIDANALKGEIDAYMKKAYDCPLCEVANFQKSSTNIKLTYAVEGLYEATEIIDEQPTVDAVEVVHGRWVNPDNTIYHCSECGKTCPYDISETSPDVINYWTCNYCPNCGAKMDGGNEDG